MIVQDSGRLAYTGKLKPADRDFYGTPPLWVELARKVMGHIELDPASCDEANRWTVKADRYFSENNDGLSQSWDCETLFLNPPYGRLLLPFARKFYNEWQAGTIGQAIILVNNTTETKAFDCFAECASVIALVRKRIQFISVDGRSQTNNTRGQVFLYCGTRRSRFAHVFRNANCRIFGAY